MLSATVSPDLESLDHSAGTQAFPAEFSIVRVFLVDGRCREATWTGDVWWLRNGAVLRRELIAAWETLPPIPEGLCHASFVA